MAAAPLTCSAAVRSPAAVGPARCVSSARRCPVSRSGCAGPAPPAGWPVGPPSASWHPAPVCPGQEHDKRWETHRGHEKETTKIKVWEAQQHLNSGAVKATAIIKSRWLRKKKHLRNPALYLWLLFFSFLYTRELLSKTSDSPPKWMKKAGFF